MFVRRPVGTLPILLIVCLTTFATIHLIPGNPATEIAGISATQEQASNIRRDRRLDQLLLSQLWHWHAKLLLGDLGRSLLLGQPVIEAAPPCHLGSVRQYPSDRSGDRPTSGTVAAPRQNAWIDEVAMVLALLWISLRILPWPCS